MHKILIIEDENDIGELILHQVQKAGYQAQLVTQAQNAKQTILESDEFDLYLLDWMIPGTSGIELCQMIKKKNANLPVIMLTALSQPDNIIAGLDAGADDYITKPFDLDVLLARMRAQLRRNLTSNHQVVIGPIVIDHEQCQVSIEQEKINLTLTEFQIIRLLAEKPGAVLTREKMINRILGENFAVSNRTIDTHIAGLRKKLKDHQNYIETIRGIGYRLRAQE